MVPSWDRPVVLVGLGDPPCRGAYRPPQTYVGYQFAVVNNGPGLALTDGHPDRVQQRLHPRWITVDLAGDLAAPGLQHDDNIALDTDVTIRVDA